MTEAMALPVSSRREWIAVAAALVAGVIALLFWLLGTSTEELREQLKVWQPWSLDACVLVGLLMGVYVLATVDRDVYRREGVRLVMLGALGAGLTIFVAPRTNRIFYDEQIYQGIGQNIADLRLAQMCNDGSVEYGRLRCASGEYNKQPYAYPHALSIAYRLFGVRDSTAFAVNAVAMGLTVCAVYVLACLLFRDRDAALFAGLLMALMPEQLVWSATAAVEPTASLALVVALVCAAYYLRSDRMAALGASVATAAYAIQFRPESLLILPVIGLVVWPRLRPDLERPRGWWAAALFLCLIAVHAAHVYAVRNVGWGTGGPRFSVRYIPANLRVNGWFYLYDERFPVLFTLLAAAGLFAARRSREGLSMATYFLLFFAIDLVFYAGSYNYGADVRYSLLTYPPLAVLGGLGAAAVARRVAGLVTAAPARSLVVTVLLFQFLWYAPIVRATTEEAWAARVDVRFARAFATEIPRNSYVLTHNPGMFHLWGVNAGQMSLVTANPAYVRFLAERYSGGIFLHWNFWCNVQDPVQTAFCQKTLATWPGDVVKEYRERDQRFAFYRLKVGN